MGEVIRFVSNSERERVRLVREARAIYDSIFPPVVIIPGDGSGHKVQAAQTVSGAEAYRSGKGPWS
jgi:hypothetical protein